MTSFASNKFNAEDAGFEPAKGLLPRVFETRAIGQLCESSEQ